MIDIFVVRGDGNVRGQDYSSPLVNSVPVALEVGRNFADEASLHLERSLTVFYRRNLRVGQLIEAQDANGNPTFRAKITGLSFTKQNPNDMLMCSLKLFQPL